jgi:hypothetical protein
MKTAALLFLPFGLLLFVPPVQTQEAPKEGDVVWAEWEVNSWYRGKIARKTDKGFAIDYDDGDKGEVELTKVALDKEPDKKHLKKDVRVLAKWSDDRFYPGKIDAIKEDGSYAIKFDDGDEGDAKLADIRLICTPPAAPGR